eukprot:jgi/Chrzof1/5506/Cz16g05230.t1
MLACMLCRPVQETELRGAALLLTRAFAGTPEQVKLDEAIYYITELFSNLKHGVTLVARLVPTDASLLPKGQSSRLVGTVALSFHAESRDDFPTLRPPEDEPYLSNMAVDAKFRRQGMARAMLDACHKLLCSKGSPAVWLHVRVADKVAYQLYQSAMYEEVARDKSGLFGPANMRPRILMKKTLSS